MNIEQMIFKETFAPTLITFTQWVLNQSIQTGKKKLYFLARDAYMSYIAAKKLVQIQNLDIECMYLEGSRTAWRQAEYHMLSDAAILKKLCIGGIHVTPRKILARGGLSDEEILLCAEEMKLEEALDEQLNYAEATGFENKLKNSASFLPLVRQNSANAYEMATEYFRQEGLMQEDTICVVDSGWVGSMQQTLANLTGREVEGFYFGLYELPSGVDKEKYHSFYFAPYKYITKKVLFSNCLFESVFSAPVGMTCGYGMENNRIVAIRETEDNPNSARISGNIHTLNELLEDADYISSVLNCSLQKILKRFSRLMSHPSPEEAKCFGEYLFSDDVNQSSLQELALPMTVKEIKNTHIIRRLLLMKGLIPGALRDSAWLEGSIVRCGKAVRYHLLQCRMYKLAIYIRKILKARG